MIGADTIAAGITQRHGLDGHGIIQRVMNSLAVCGHVITAEIQLEEDLAVCDHTRRQ